MTTVNSTTYEAQASGKMALDQGIGFAPLKVVSGEYTAASTASVCLILSDLP